MNQRIRHRLWLLVCMLSVIIVFPRQVHADMGPKPSVHIQFENMDDEYMAGRARDIADIKDRIIGKLYNEEKIMP